MSACSLQNFSNITPAVWQCMVAKAASYGVTISSDSGSDTKSGYTIAWNYDPTSQTGSIQCTDSPFYMPCSAINSYINKIAKGCGAVAN
jgi:hypothetical protein